MTLTTKGCRVLHYTGHGEKDHLCFEDGKGGLRDLQTLFWIAKYIYDVDEVGQLIAKGVFKADEAEIFALARYHTRIHMFAAPTMVKRMTEIAKATGESGEGLRTVVYAGGPMYEADILEAVDVLGPRFVQIYGQGECPMGITALSRHDVTDRRHPRWRERLASVGRAQSAVEVRIGDAEGNPLPPGEHGEIMVKGDTVMPGYWQNPEATAKTLRLAAFNEPRMYFPDPARIASLIRSDLEAVGLKVEIVTRYKEVGLEFDIAAVECQS